MSQGLQLYGKSVKMNGPGILAKGHPGPDHSEPIREVRTMADTSQYSDSAPPGKPEQNSVLSADDVARCREINMRYRDRVKTIALAVSAETCIPLAAIYGRSRVSNIVSARRLVMYLAHRSGLSLAAIGQALNRDHTTVMDGVRQERIRRGEA